MRQRKSRSGKPAVLYELLNTSLGGTNRNDGAAAVMALAASWFCLLPITAVTPYQTGIMTAWNKIDVEYVKMDSADEVPVEGQAAGPAMRCVLSSSVTGR